MQRFESRSPRLESWQISIPECGGSNPVAPTGQSVSNACGIGVALEMLGNGPGPRLVTKKEVLDFHLPPRFEQIGDQHRKQIEDGKHRI
jgi:hypothetical protein